MNKFKHRADRYKGKSKDYQEGYYQGYIHAYGELPPTISFPTNLPVDYNNDTYITTTYGQNQEDITNEYKDICSTCKFGCGYQIWYLLDNIKREMEELEPKRYPDPHSEEDVMAYLEDWKRVKRIKQEMVDFAMYIMKLRSRSMDAMDRGEDVPCITSSLKFKSAIEKFNGIMVKLNSTIRVNSSLFLDI